MGYRAIRFCLDHRDIFLTQLRAILRASAYGKVKILLPMISSIREVEKSKLLIEQAKEELTSADGAASEEQIANLKTLCKDLMEKDEAQEDFVQQIAMKTDGFTNITASACTALCQNLEEIISQYGE